MSAGIIAVTYEDAHTVALSDAVADPNGPFAALLVSVAGTVKITTIRGTDVAFTVIAGEYVRVATQRVWSTGTSATVIGLSAPPYSRLGT